MRKFILSLLAIFSLVAVIFLYSFFKSGNQKRPDGITGPQARALFDAMAESIGYSRWKKLDAVGFVFLPTGATHFRDKSRGLVEVQYLEKTDHYRLQYELNGPRTIGWLNNKPLKEDDLEEAVSIARTYHKRDYFWLSPFEGIDTGNTVLKKVGNQALLATFLNEDGTEGDAYLIVSNSKGRPTHLKMWAAGLPVQGMESSFDKWKEFPDNILLSLRRKTFLQEIEFGSVEVYKEYPVPGEEDIFASLLKSKPPVQSQ